VLESGQMPYANGVKHPLDISEGEIRFLRASITYSDKLLPIETCHDARDNERLDYREEAMDGQARPECVSLAIGWAARQWLSVC